MRSVATTWLKRFALESAFARLSFDDRTFGPGTPAPGMGIFAVVAIDPEACHPRRHDDRARPLVDGRFELAKGAVSSYYEFRWPTSEQRLTDEAWRAMLESASQGDAGQPVDRPSWQAPFLVGAKIAKVPVPDATP